MQAVAGLILNTVCVCVCVGVWVWVCVHRNNGRIQRGYSSVFPHPSLISRTDLQISSTE